MQLRCRSCAEVVPAAHINLPTSMATCPACHAVFSFAGDVLVPREHVGRPEQVRIEGSEPIVISWPFVDPKQAVTALVAVLVLVAVMVWIVLQADPSPVPFQLVGMGVGVSAMILAVVVAFVNRTTLHIGRREVRRSIGPFPMWKGTASVPSSAIAQVFCVRKTRYLRSQKRRDAVEPVYSWAVVVKRNDGGPEVTLVTGLSEPRHGVFLEQQIERHLRIEDKAVAGAVV
jgi:hypothetical protein